MYPSRRHPGTPPIGQPRPTTGEQQFIAAWLGHVAAGRIGSPTQMTQQELAVQRANEMAVLGHSPTFTPPPVSGWER